MLTDEQKYSGDGQNESLDHKLTIFYDICNRVSLPAELYTKAFPAILKGIAQDHYYSNLLSQRPLPDVITNLKNFFEGPGFHRRNLASWNNLTLNHVIGLPENAEKSTQDCLRILINTLTKLKFGLEPELRTSAFMHNKLVTACQGVPVYKFAIYNPL